MMLSILSPCFSLASLPCLVKVFSRPSRPWEADPPTSLSGLSLTYIFKYPSWIRHSISFLCYRKFLMWHPFTLWNSHKYFILVPWCLHLVLVIKGHLPCIGLHPISTIHLCKKREAFHLFSTFLKGIFVYNGWILLAPSWAINDGGALICVTGLLPNNTLFFIDVTLCSCHDLSQRRRWSLGEGFIKMSCT